MTVLKVYSDYAHHTFLMLLQKPASCQCAVALSVQNESTAAFQMLYQASTHEVLQLCPNVSFVAVDLQVGSLVPAESAELHVLDAVHTRMGASDNLAMGSSTFLEVRLATQPTAGTLVCEMASHSHLLRCLSCTHQLTCRY